MNPIFDALKSGSRFPFPLLAAEVEDLKLYWEWWWETHALTTLDRPYTICDDDPILTPTMGKTTVDTQSGIDFFNPAFLLRLIKAGMIPEKANMPRGEYRGILVRNFTLLAPQLEAPVAIFGGGGYGSGKTTTFDFIRINGGLPFPQAAILGVDNFKLYLPEFDQIRMVSDGRASSTVQEEAQFLAQKLFEKLAEERRSFAWDSSMSNPVETIKRLELLKTAGYSLRFVAVLTPLQTAIRLSMARAKQGRRFPHPTKLPESHTGFLQNFYKYLDYFDAVQVFFNDAPEGLTQKKPPVLVAETDASKSLVIHNRNLFHSLVPELP